MQPRLVAELVERDAVIGHRRDAAGQRRQPVGRGIGGARRIALGEEGVGQIVVRLVPVGPRGQHRAERLFGLVEAFELLECQTEIALALHGVGGDVERARIGLRRLGMLAERHQRVAEIVMRRGEVGLDRDRGAVGLDGRLRLALLLQRAAEIVMRLEELRIVCDGSTVMFYRGLRVAHAQRDHASESMHVGASGLERQDLAADGQGVGQAPRLKKRARLLLQGGDLCRRRRVRPRSRPTRGGSSRTTIGFARAHRPRP